MTFSKDLYSIIDRLGLEVQPVAVKYLSRQPEGIERLDEKLALCEMLKKAQEGKVFLADAASQACEAGSYTLN